MPGKPISKSTADSMAKDYVNFMQNLGVDMNKQTQYVSFTGSTIMKWLDRKMAEADELRVYMGVYPPGHPQAGHTTVIFWPYKDGKPVPAAALQQGKGGDDDPDDAFDDGMGAP